ncbi:MAG: protein-export chaperone SecB [Bacteroidia bacterium]|nr:protein-export chaperone SecB [Bacteroidia bacterium]
MQHNPPLIKENPHFKILSIHLLDFSLSHPNEIKTNTPSDSLKIDYDVTLGTSFKVNQENILYVLLKSEIHAKLENQIIKTIQTTYIGIFQSINPETSELSLQTFATHNAPAIIYPYFRQFIHEITLHTGLPPLTLPIIMLKPEKQNN